MSKPDIVIEVIGEGKTDIGEVGKAVGVRIDRPTEGVIPVLLSGLCGDPPEMRVVRRKYADIQQRGGLKQKLKFAKTQAYYSERDGLVFVVDTEGLRPDLKLAELAKASHGKFSDFPTALGVAHPCIEAWLLADAKAIERGAGLKEPPTLPEDPESLPAPLKRTGNDPKSVLARCANRNEALPAAITTEIARSIRDLNFVEQKCPLGFGRFAEEVRENIRPLFEPAGDG